jgi:uncharacterized protein (UPF0333 family)
MAYDNATIIALSVFLLLVIIILIAYSYYPFCDINTSTPAVDPKDAQVIVSKSNKSKDDVFNSPPRQSDALWKDWKQKYETAQKRTESQSP